MFLVGKGGVSEISPETKSVKEMGMWACNKWYEEMEDYKYPGDDAGYLDCSETKPEKVNHFTQVRIK